jgi:hypothetical protein
MSETTSSRSRPEDVVLQRVHGSDDDLVAAPVGEGEPLAFEAGIGAEDDVGGGVVTEVEGVGAVLVEGGGEADVVDGEGGDGHGGEGRRGATRSATETQRHRDTSCCERRTQMLSTPRL